MRPGLRRAGVLMAVAVLGLTGCKGKQGPEASGGEPPTPQQVELSYTVPKGMTEVSVPSATPSAGVSYDIKLYRSADSCELRVVRLLIPKGDDQEDQDVTYNMLGAIMKSSGINEFTTNGVMVPGDPGPIPTLTVSGQTSTATMRAIGRLSNESKQGYQLVYGCGKGKLVEKTWDALVKSLSVKGFTGPLTEH
ncbi:hypothetical protein AAEX63_00915 [Luteococcus sp. H138]|uniref:hypothetical protein n=1 Tax=unclassified Luteococcus TaxID=2639923 RepID=UPI00313D0F1B